MDIIDSLQILGLNHKEALVYQALLALKKGSALTIARQAKIKRPTTYFVLESLKAKGLITSTIFRGVKDYRALTPEHLKRYIKKQKSLLQDNIAAMDNLYSQRKKKLRLRVYSGLGSVKILLEKVLREKKDLYIIGDMNNFSNQLGEYWNFFLKRGGQLNIRPNFKDIDSNIGLLLWSDKVAFVYFDDNVQSVAFKNKDLNELYLQIWKNY